MLYFRTGMARYPWTSGHEWSGVVDTVGEGVADLKPGDRVIGEVTLSCGKCEACLAGRPQLCWPRTEVGITGGYPGAFAEFIRMPARHVLKVPPGVSLREAAMAEPTAVVLHGTDIMGLRLFYPTTWRNTRRKFAPRIFRISPAR